jgi:hypothetical protein
MFPYLLMLLSGLLGIVALLAGASLTMEGQQVGYAYIAAAIAFLALMAWNPGQR